MTQGWLDILNILIGVASVPLISLLKRVDWSKYSKVLLSTIVPLLASAGITIPLEGFDIINPETQESTSLLLSIIGAQLSYKLFMEDTKVEKKLAVSLVKPKEKE